VVTLCTAAVAYPVLVKVFPEPREVFGPSPAVAEEAVSAEA
jgi:hypothetical protein